MSNHTNLLVEIIAAATGRDQREIDLELPFNQMGIESLQAVHIIDRLSKQLGREISPAIMYDCPTVKSLVDYLDGKSDHKIISSTQNKSTQGPIAITGMACKFPGANDLRSYWKLLKDGHFAISDVPHDRPELLCLKSGQPNHIPWGGYIQGEDLFDNDSFGIPPQEASRMDPQQRLLLMTAWHAIEDAGLSPSELSGSRTGVFVGISSNDYSIVCNEQHKKNVFDATGNAHSIAANRISYQFNLKGPSISIDTACSSSLVAIHQAVTSLNNGEIDFALVGGVNLALNPQLSIAFAEAGMLSPDGKCKTFSEEANGYVRGEGAGFVFLKRAADAIADKDRIYAQILGTAVNQDGLTNGLTAPNGQSQEQVIREALDRAQTEPHEIGLIEAHGTGTALGDPIEYLALHRVFGDNHNEVHLGSVKTNIGHLEAAAGIAGLIKIALAIHNNWIPKLLHFTKLNSKIGDFRTSLVPSIKGTRWEQPSRKAGISSFGFGGTNSHAILSEAPLFESISDSSTSEATSVEFSTPTMDELPVMAQQWLDYLESVKKIPHTPSHRMDMKIKHYIIGRNFDEVKSALKLAVKSEKCPLVISIQDTKKTQKSTAWLFTGQGSQYTGMGLELIQSNSLMKHYFENCCEEFNRYLSEELSEVMFRAEKAHLLEQTDYAQAAIFTIDYCLAMTIRDSFGITPDYLLGHSLGEIAALTFAEALSLEDAVFLVAMRGQQMQLSSPGAMINVSISLKEIKLILDEKKYHLDIAAINGPENVVLSGSKDEILKIEEALRNRSIKYAPLKVTKAFHSSLMDPILDNFEKSIRKIDFKEPKIKIISSLTGDILSVPLNSGYFKDHARQTTLFQTAMNSLENLKVNVFLELGSHPTLTTLGQFCLPRGRNIWLSTLKRGNDAYLDWLKLTAYLNGYGLKNSSTVHQRFFPPAPLSDFHLKKFWNGERKMSPLKKQEIVMSSQSKVLDELRKIVASLLYVDISEVDVDQPLIDSGADSLILLNAVQDIKDRYHVDIAISDIFYELSTIRKIADHIELRMPKTQLSNQAPAVQQTSFQQDQQTQMIMPQFQGMMGMPQMQGIPYMFMVPVNPFLFAQTPQMQQQLMSQMMPFPGAMPGFVPQQTQSEQVPPKNQPSETKGVLGLFKSEAIKTSEKQDSSVANYLKNMSHEFVKKTGKSKEQTQNYRKFLADNRVSAGFRPNTKEMVYPIIFKDAAGARFHDLDGNEYIDFTMGFGVNLFGHNPDFIINSVKQQLDLGMAVGPQSSLAGPVAKLITELTGHDRVAFLNSGTEAIMTAIRLARAVTKRDKLVIFNGSYHGHFDGVLSRPSKDKSGIPVAPGVIQSFSKDVIVLEYGDKESIEYIKRVGHEVAAVIVEPVQSRFPEQRPQEFLKELRLATKQSNSALIFDEVITGFRIHTGGSQAYFGVKADLATYGKVLGGGLPIGAVAGDARFMDPIDGGYWEFGDDSYPGAEMTFFAGTFCKHPLAMAAAQSVLEKLKNEGDQILRGLNQRTDKMCREINTIFQQHQVDLQANNFGSLFRFKSNSNIDSVFYELNLRGFYVWEGRNMFLSTAHTEEDIEMFIKTIESIVIDLVREGILKKKVHKLEDRPAEVSTFPLITPQERFATLSTKNIEGQLASHICVSVKMKGPLNFDLLQKSLDTVINHYDIFSFRFDLESQKQFCADRPDWKIEYVDISKEKRPWKKLDSILLENGKILFDLKKDCPARFYLYDVVEETSVFAMICHHIAIDGWSIAQFVEDVAKVYSSLDKGDLFNLPKRLSYADFIRNPLRFGTLQKENEAKLFWENKFSNKEINYFPFSLAKRSSLSGARFIFSIDYNEYTDVKNLAKKHKVTPFIYLLTAFYKTLMARHHMKDFTIGIPAGNRNLDGADKMMGQCANLLSFRLSADQDEETQSILKKVKQEMVNSFRFMIHPYEKLEEFVGKPLFNISFNMEPTTDLPDFGPVSLFIHPFPITVSEFELTINITDLDYHYHCEIDYSTEVLNESDILKLSQEFTAMVKKVNLSLE